MQQKQKLPDDILQAILQAEYMQSLLNLLGYQDGFSDTPVECYNMKDLVHWVVECSEFDNLQTRYRDEDWYIAASSGEDAHALEKALKPIRDTKCTVIRRFESV